MGQFLRDESAGGTEQVDVTFVERHVSATGMCKVMQANDTKRSFLNLW